MRLAFVSTYPPSKCGIGQYTRNLVQQIVAVEPATSLLVAAEQQDFDAYDDGPVRCQPCFRRAGDYVDDVLRTVKAQGSELVHIQHSADILGEDERLVRLLQRLRQAGMRSVVTLHTVHGPRYERLLQLRPPSCWFHRKLAQHADRLVVHQQRSMADRLVAQGVARERIAVIAHGTALMPPADPVESRLALGLPTDRTILLFFGFIHAQKNLQTALEAFLRIKPRRLRAMLLIAGKPFDNAWYNRLLIQVLKARTRLSPEGRCVEFRQGYVAPEQVPQLFAAADIVLLPHWQRYGSASGVFHQIVGAGKPFVCASGPKFENALDVFADMPEIFVPPLAVGRWSTAMKRLVTDTGLRDRCRQAATAYAQATAWPQVARRHLNVYEDVLQGR